ncbi:MAG: single-stranded-DNA-specific exonuclease RecJ [Lentisphaeria bacterium]|nr:single-stranded-DNA-specific exonuclease RecJ [Lentisphaeria bacterium]MBR7127647.1 single-stranded-DNA-specific exonuclease RecJ [Lentisphaeria bacterium]
MGVLNWKNNCRGKENQIRELQESCGLPRAIAAILAARNIAPADVDAFLDPRLAKLSDPYRFPGIEIAAKRLWDAIINKEPILIHGDYDTDGITASALLSLVLRKNGAEVFSFIPHRFDDGYGFTPESLEKALAHMPGCKVLVTVDCGITSCDAVDVAISRGIDVIITDHHEASNELPKAIALINPKIYPELEDMHLLSGVGSAFKLSHAFVKYGRAHNLGGFGTKLEEVMDYIALGTVADIVPILGENRIMVKYGIEILRKQLRPGVRALSESINLKHDLMPTDITFKLAPRINAAGRVGDANIALELLESDNIVEAYRFAGELEKFNRIRQNKEQEIYREAKKQIENNLAWSSEYVILVAGRDWHQGVIGIVASRLARDYNRPAIVLTIQGDNAYGSGRSVGSLNFVEVLGNAAHVLERYGGHPMAVGIGLRADRLTAFFEIINESIKNVISKEDLVQYISYDEDMQVSDLDMEIFKYMDKLAPFGHSNPKPLFRFNELTILSAKQIKGNHVRGVMRDRTGRIEFIMFNMSIDKFPTGCVDVLATPQVNYNYNAGAPQLNIAYIAEHEVL